MASQYLPASDNRLLVFVVVLVAAFYGLLGSRGYDQCRKAPISLGIALPFAVLSWGMWRLKSGALDYGIRTLVLCDRNSYRVLNPFAAMEWEGGATAMGSLGFLGRGRCRAGSVLLHVLGKHRGDFGVGRPALAARPTRPRGIRRANCWPRSSRAGWLQVGPS